MVFRGLVPDSVSDFRFGPCGGLISGSAQLGGVGGLAWFCGFVGVLSCAEIIIGGCFVD